MDKDLLQPYPPPPQKKKIRGSHKSFRRTLESKHDLRTICAWRMMHPHWLTTVQFTEKRQTISTDLVTVNTECPSCCSVVRPSVCRTIEREREPNTQINTTDVPRSHTTHNRHVWMTPHVSECRGRGEGAVISLSHYPLYVCVHNESVYTCRHDKRRPRGFVCVTAAVGQVHTGKPAPPRGDRWPL